MKTIDRYRLVRAEIDRLLANGVTAEEIKQRFTIVEFENSNKPKCLMTKEVFEALQYGGIPIPQALKYRC